MLLLFYHVSVQTENNFADVIVIISCEYRLKITLDWVKD